MDHFRNLFFKLKSDIYLFCLWVFLIPILGWCAVWNDNKSSFEIFKKPSSDSLPDVKIWASICGHLFSKVSIWITLKGCNMCAFVLRFYLNVGLKTQNSKPKNVFFCVFKCKESMMLLHAFKKKKKNRSFSGQILTPLVCLCGFLSSGLTTQALHFSSWAPLCHGCTTPSTVPLSLDLSTSLLCASLALLQL